VAIRYSLLLRSEDQLLETPQAYTYNGVITTPPATDRRLRQVVTGTISIRSRLN
jgi:carbonic anhydrase